MQQTLYILWASSDPLSARHMVFMYANNALRHGWWQQVHIIVWGSSAKLLAEDKCLQNELRKFIQLGGQVSVCRRCAEKLGVLVLLQKLEGLDELNIYYLGEFFTQLIKDGEKIISV